MKTSTIGAFFLAAIAVFSGTAAVPERLAAHSRPGPTEPAAVSSTEEPADMSAEDNAPTNPDGNADAAVISSCDDLPADVVDADGLVLVRGPIICHQTKMIRVADGAADVTFVSDRGMYFRGVIFDVPPGKNMFFTAPTATFVSNEVMLAPIFDEVLQGPRENDLIFIVGGNLVFDADSYDFYISPEVILFDAYRMISKGGPGAEDAEVHTVGDAALHYTSSSIFVFADKGKAEFVRDLTHRLSNIKINKAPTWLGRELPARARQKQQQRQQQQQQQQQKKKTKKKKNKKNKKQKPTPRSPADDARRHNDQDITGGGDGGVIDGDGDKSSTSRDGPRSLASVDEGGKGSDGGSGSSKRGSTSAGASRRQRRKEDQQQRSQRQQQQEQKQQQQQRKGKKARNKKARVYPDPNSISHHLEYDAWI